MMASSAEPTDVLGVLYDAVGRDEAWGGVVQHLCEAFEASIGMLVVTGQGQRDQSFYAAHNHSEAAARAYSDHWWQHDVWLLAALQQGVARKGMIAIGTELVRPEALHASAFYREFLLTMPAEHLLVCMLSDGSEALGAPPMHLSLFRPPGAPPFTGEHKAQLRALMPHIHRAFELHWRARTASEQLAIFHGSLSRMDFGVVFIDSARRVRFANEVAESLLPPRLWSPIPGAVASLPLESQVRGLRTQPLPARGPLAELLDRAACGEGGSLALAATASDVGDASQRTMVLALPVAQSPSHAAGQTRAAVMLLIANRASSTERLVDFVSSAFGLTRSEARLLPHLLRGLSPGEIAQALDLKLPTVRSQLSAIFAKTGTSRQQDLIRLLGALPALS